MYTGSLSNLPNAECDACRGCLCRPGTIQGPDGTCDPVSNTLVHGNTYILYCVHTSSIEITTVPIRAENNILLVKTFLSLSLSLSLFPLSPSLPLSLINTLTHSHTTHTTPPRKLTSASGTPSVLAVLRTGSQRALTVICCGDKDAIQRSIPTWMYQVRQCSLFSDNVRDRAYCIYIATVLQ